MISAHYLGATCNPLNLATGANFLEVWKFQVIQIAVNELLAVHPKLDLYVEEVRTDGVFDSKTASAIHEIFGFDSHYGDFPGPRADLYALGSDACELAAVADSILAELRAMIAEAKAQNRPDSPHFPTYALTTEASTSRGKPAYLALAIAGFGVALVGGYFAFVRKRR